MPFFTFYCFNKLLDNSIYPIIGHCSRSNRFENRTMTPNRDSAAARAHLPVGTSRGLALNYTELPSGYHFVIFTLYLTLEFKDPRL